MRTSTNRFTKRNQSFKNKHPPPLPRKHGWGSFEKLEACNLTPVRFHDTNEHNVGTSREGLRSENINSGIPHSSRNIAEARIRNHVEEMKSLALQRVGPKVYGQHVPIVADSSTLDITKEQTEETFFSSNPWVLHRKFPYYRQFLSRDLPSRHRASRSTVTPLQGGESKSSNKKKYTWNTWSLIPHTKESVTRSIRTNSSPNEFHRNESIYRDCFPTFISQTHLGACQLPVSLYTRQRLQPEGITMIRDFITDAEEKDIVAEIMSTTMHRGKDPTQPTNYIPEDGRYCTNYFDTELSVPGRGAVAWSTADLPLLGKALFRALQLNMIPRMPNTFQINEYVTDFAGFSRHKKPDSLGSYIGILTLISSDVLRLYHQEYTWAPRVFLEPRSLVVLQKEARYEYSMATLRERRPVAQKNTQGFRDSLRRTHMNFVNFTKDYRIDVMFAHVDVANHGALKIAQNMTKAYLTTHSSTAPS
ncbi:2OG-Fe(II) oxygenase family oxidoreductase [Perkinsela sp. CCAP 1560/4]|nr:2OG-Fe(II) oxygenase family oxidoreductase [Perkinsela sp. CCAP 1560/4]|eukprot:KNH07967.1 2OG-Fe(II) oxygenase family oxidoreductase [Perkinsela sp. CCAP 1560/4]